MDINIFLFILAVSFIVLTSIGILSLFGSTYWLEQIILFFVISSANIVLAALVLSLFKGINPYGYLIIHIVFLFLTFLVIRLTGKRFTPPLPQIDLSRLKELKKHPAILILGTAVLIFLATSIFLVLLVPPNNWDSMTYHLSRIGFWLQNGSLDFFQTYNPRQNYMPPNAEILMMWQIAFIKSDVFAGFVQWISYLGTLLIIYGIAMELGSSSIQSIFASLVWASIPEVMLEATSTQNDLVVTFFLMASVFFILRGCKNSDWKWFVISGISLGLAVGTKLTAIFAMPGIFIGALFLFYKAKNLWKGLSVWIASILIGTIIFGSHSYIQSYSHYGSPFGTKEVLSGSTSPNIMNMFYNLYHIGHRFLDTSGLPFVEIPGFFHILYFHEDNAGYGLVWLFFGVPVFFYAMYKGFFKNDFLKAWIFIIAVGYLLSFSFALKINPWIFRLLIPFTAMVCPLVAPLYPQEDKYKKINWYKKIFISIAVIGAISIFTCTFFNISKPVYLPIPDRKGIFEMSFYEKRFFYPSKIDDMMIYKELDKMAQKGERVGIIASGDDWDYPAFGKRFERKVFPVLLNKLDTDKDIFTQYNLDYLIVYAPIQEVDGIKIDVMPFLEQVMKQNGNSIRFMRAGNIFLFKK